MTNALPIRRKTCQGLPMAIGPRMTGLYSSPQFFAYDPLLTHMFWSHWVLADPGTLKPQSPKVAIYVFV